jgi:ribosomal protein S18 acetylase RimI-like enzyme
MDGPLYFLAEVDTSDKAESLRLIRNECRAFMTNNTEEISPEQQQEWYESLDRSQMIPYLFVEGVAGVCFLPIGYGLIRSKDGVTLLTGGLKENQRDKGLGVELFLCLIDKAKEVWDQPIHLEVRLDNPRAQKLYQNLGFEPLYYTNDIMYMELVE